jgi:hypothetical protein
MYSIPNIFSKGQQITSGSCNLQAPEARLKLDNGSIGHKKRKRQENALPFILRRLLAGQSLQRRNQQISTRFHTLAVQYWKNGALLWHRHIPISIHQGI